MDGNIGNIEDFIPPIEENEDEMNCPKCSTPIKEHPAGKCLDILFIERVMMYFFAVDKSAPHLRIVMLDSLPNLPKLFSLITATQAFYMRAEWAIDFEPSTNISHAFEGVEKHISEDEDFRFSLVYLCQSKEWIAQLGRPWLSNGSSEKELAITRALILWAGRKEKKNNEG
jgi:hypothetical protein